MYHRVAEPPYDPWGLSVQPRRFEEQMRALKTFRVPLSMGEFVARLEKRALPQLAVGITFDDGYIDNLRVAKPILDETAVPATIFLTTGFLGGQQEFWWDELARLTLGRREPAEGVVVIGGRSIAVRLPALPNDAEVSVDMAGLGAALDRAGAGLFGALGGASRPWVRGPRGGHGFGSRPAPPRRPRPERYAHAARGCAASCSQET